MYTIFFLIAVVIGIIIAVFRHDPANADKTEKSDVKADNAMPDEDMLAAALWDDDIDLFKDK